MVEEKLGLCDRCGEPRIEMIFPHLEMTAYLCPGCETIRVIDHRGEYPEDEEPFPKQLMDNLFEQVAA